MGELELQSVLAGDQLRRTARQYVGLDELQIRLVLSFPLRIHVLAVAFDILVNVHFANVFQVDFKGALISGHFVNAREFGFYNNIGVRERVAHVVSASESPAQLHLNFP